MGYKNICVFGDSIAKGIGVPDESYSWCSILSKYYSEVNVINHGIGGQTSSAALKRLDDLLKDSPDITTLQFGMNDHCLDEEGNFSVPRNVFRRNLITMIDSLYKINSEVILITNHSIIEGNEHQYYYHRHPQNAYQKYGGANTLIEYYNQIIREIAEKYNTYCLDMHAISSNYDKYEFLRSLENSDIDDGVHPHILGSKVYAQELIKIINEIKKAE